MLALRHSRLSPVDTLAGLHGGVRKKARCSLLPILMRTSPEHPRPYHQGRVALRKKLWYENSGRKKEPRKFRTRLSRLGKVGPGFAKGGILEYRMAELCSGWTMICLGATKKRGRP